jgi:tight adherence protein B
MVNMPAGQWVAAVLVFLAVAFGTIALAVFVEWLSRVRRQKRVAAQLERLSTEALDTMAPGAASIFRRVQVVEAGWVQALSSYVPHLRDIEQMLEQAALEWSVRSYMVFALGLAAAGGITVYLFSGSGMFSLAAAACCAFLPYLFVRNRRSRRFARFEENFPEAVDLLGRALRAGHPFTSGIKMVAEEMAEPISSEFRTVFEEQRFGMPFGDTLNRLADRMPLVDVRIFVTAVMIQREVGGNLTEILDNLAHIIRQRFMLQRQVKVLTAEGRYSVYVLTALPVCIALFVYLTNPEYLRPLVEHPMGRLMLYGALVGQVIGYIWMQRITQIDF